MEVEWDVKNNQGGDIHFKISIPPAIKYCKGAQLTKATHVNVIKDFRMVTKSDKKPQSKWSKLNSF